VAPPPGPPEPEPPPPRELGLDELWARCDVDGIPPATTRRVPIAQPGAKEAVVATLTPERMAPPTDPLRFVLFGFRSGPDAPWRIAGQQTDRESVLERGSDDRLTLTLVLGRLTGAAAIVTLDPETRRATAWAASFTDVVPPGTMPWEPSGASLALSSEVPTEGTVTLELRLRGRAPHEDGSASEAVVCAMIDAIVPP
jgi:hypothetical protein